MDLNEIKKQTEHQTERKPFEITEDKILNYLLKRKKEVVDGQKNGYELALFLKELDDIIKGIKSEIIDTVLSEFEDKYEYNGFRFEKTQSGRYTYNHSKDWNDMNEKRKELEKIMQMSFKTGKSIINEETGEVYESAVYKPNKESYKISKIK